MSDHEPKTEYVLSFVDGNQTTVSCQGHWLREMVMSNSWFSIGDGNDERWFNGAHIVGVHQPKDYSF